MRTSNPAVLGRFPRWIITLAVVLVALIVLSFLLRPFWYFDVINIDGVGIKIEAGQITAIKQPGIASNVGLFVKVGKIKTSAVVILVEYPELISSDNQRIGV